MLGLLGQLMQLVEIKKAPIDLVGGIPTPLKNMKVNIYDHSQYMENNSHVLVTLHRCDALLIILSCSEINLVLLAWVSR